MFEGVLDIVNLTKFGIRNVIGFNVTDNPGVRENIANEITKCNKHFGGRCYITLEQPFKPRTRSQGSKLNALIREICKKTGNNFNDVKDACKRLAVQWHDYPCDEEEKDGICILKPWGEEKLNTVQMGWLIEAAEYYGAEYAGIY